MGPSRRVCGGWFGARCRSVVRTLVHGAMGRGSLKVKCQCI